MRTPHERLWLCLGLAAFASACTIEPFDPAGKTCRVGALCPATYTCVFPPLPVDTQAGGTDDAGESNPPPREGTCELAPCARVVCPAGEVCVKDACYPKDCTQVVCGPNEVCESGDCVARSCVGVSCTPQNGCALASCYPRACANQTCGEGELCIQESCTDARCVNVTCPQGQSCVRGFCYQERCGNTVCPEDHLCVGSSCVERTCVGKVCAAGLLGVRGSCQKCADGLLEVQGTCVAPLAIGAQCQATGECTDGGTCVDGRCCAAQSCEACQRCDMPGAEGQCAAVDAGAVEASCQGYVCAPGGTCATSCSVDGDCAADRFCDNGQCAPKKPQGGVCAAGRECASSHCVSGRCCDSACDGECQSCVQSGSEGTCTALAINTAISACAPYTCAADGGCRTSCSIDGGCAAGSTCAANVCTGLKGNGASCDAGTQCTSTACVDGVCCNGPCAGSCDQCNLPGALGTCTPLALGSAGSPSCSPRACNGTAGGCPTTCTADNQCATGFYCSAGACLAKKPAGQPCGAPSHCQTNFCVNGVCCGTACAGVCETCSTGACAPKGAVACTVSSVSGTCVGTACTAIRTVLADRDAWVSSVTGYTTNYGNGSGARLVVGKTDYVTPSGAGKNRTLLRFPLTSLFSGVTNATQIKKVELKLRVRGPAEGPTSCWSIGSSVKFLVEELTGTFTENSENEDCVATSSGAADSEWPGPSATTANRGRYSGAPAQGNIITVDLTAMVKAAFTAGKQSLSVRLIASNSADAYDELTEARKVAFNSRHASSPPTLELTFTP